MLEYTRIEPPMEIIATGDNVLRGTAQGILIVVVHGTDDVLETAKIPVVVVPGLKRNIFFISAAAQKGVKKIIEISDLSLELRLFSVQLSWLDNMDHLDLTIAKKVEGQSLLFAHFKVKRFGKESVLTALVSKNHVALSVVIISVDQRVVESTLLSEGQKQK